MRRWFLVAMLAALVGVSGQAGPARAQAAHLSAEQQIARLPGIYAWSVDSLDIDTLMTIFSDDIEYDLSAYGLPGAQGKDAVRNIFLEVVFRGNQCSFINISSIWSKINGDEAIGGDYFVHVGINPVTSPPLPPNTRRQTDGRHIYRFRKVDGEWKISYIRGEVFSQTVATFDPALLFRCPLPPARTSHRYRSAPHA